MIFVFSIQIVGHSESISKTHSERDDLEIISRQHTKQQQQQQQQQHRISLHTKNIVLHNLNAQNQASNLREIMYIFKETKSATMNIFRKKKNLF